MSLKEQFPNFVPSFDYSKWEDKETYIKFLSVPWDAHYSNVVDWKSEKDRDKYFEDAKGHIINYTTGWNFKSLEVFKPGLGKHVGSISVNAPYEQMVNYNYLMVEMYEQPIPGTKGVGRRETFFYFITSLNKVAPNTTEMYIEMDTWTTFKNSIQFKSINLSRGHYPHAKTSAADFLADPINRTYGITDIEPDLPELAPLVSYEKFVSFQGDIPRVCFATSVNITANHWVKIEGNNLKRVKATPAKNWGDNLAQRASKGAIPAASVGLPNTASNTIGTNVYSISVKDFPNFISTLRSTYPQVLKSITSIFILSSNLISEGNSFKALGYTLKKVTQQANPKLLATLKVTEDMFRYSATEKQFAKLYTGQFAKIEISNLQGKIAELSLEDVSKSLDVYAKASTVFPALKLEGFVNGIGGKTSKKYAVKPFNAKNASLFESSWEDFLFDLNIPTYGVFAEYKELNAGEYNTKNVSEFKTIDNKLKNEISVISKDYTNAKVLASTEVETGLRSAKTERSNSRATIANTRTNDKLSNSADFKGKTADIDITRREAVNAVSQAKSDLTKINAEQQQILNMITKYEHPVHRESEYPAYLTYKNKSISYSMAEHNYRMKVGMKPVAAINTFNRVRKASRMNAIGDIWQAGEMGDLGIALNGFSTIFNATGEAIDGNFGGALTSAINGILNNENIQESYNVNVKMIADKQNLVDGSDLYDAKYSGTTGGWDPNGGTDHYINLRYNEFGDPLLGESNTDGLSRVNIPYNLWTQFVNIESDKNPSIIYNNETGVDAYQGPSISAIMRKYTLGMELTDLFFDSRREINEIRLQKRLDEANYDYVKSVSRLIEAKTRIVAPAITANVDNAALAASLAENIYNYKYKNGFNSSLDDRRGLAYAARDYDYKKNDDIIDNTYDTDSDIIDRNYSSTSSNIDTVNNSTLKVARNNYLNANNVSKNLASQDKYNVTSDLIAKLSTGELGFIGENNGETTASWGLTGLDIRVKRCTSGTAKRAADIFLRYGYTTDSLRVRIDSLSLMSEFTYWQGEDLWIIGDKINETNKAIIREAFYNGVTVWKNPKNIANIDITNNKI